MAFIREFLGIIVPFPERLQAMAAQMNQPGVYQMGQPGGGEGRRDRQEDVAPGHELGENHDLEVGDW